MNIDTPCSITRGAIMVRHHHDADLIRQVVDLCERESSSHDCFDEVERHTLAAWLLEIRCDPVKEIREVYISDLDMLSLSEDGRDDFESSLSELTVRARRILDDVHCFHDV